MRNKTTVILAKLEEGLILYLTNIEHKKTKLILKALN